MSAVNDDIIILAGRDGKIIHPEDRERLIEMARVMFDEMERENKELHKQGSRHRRKETTVQKRYDAQDYNNRSSGEKGPFGLKENRLQDRNH